MSNFQVYSGWAVVWINETHIALSLKKEYSYTAAPTMVLHSQFEDELLQTVIKQELHWSSYVLSHFNISIP